MGGCDADEVVEEKDVHDVNEVVEENVDDVKEEILEEEEAAEILEEEEASNHCVHSCGGDDSMTASVTLLSGPDTSSPLIEASEWERDLDYRFG